MAQAAANSSSAGGSINAIIGPQYCAPNPVELAIRRKVLSMTQLFAVTDAYGNPLFKVETKPFSLHDRRIILDAAGFPILTLQLKVWTFHSTWQVFRGESTDPNHLIFTAKLASLIQFKTKLNVYLTHNTSQEFCDFQVKQDWLERSCVVYAGESTSAIVAEMHKKHTASSFFLGKDKFVVTVYPNMDYAFIVALLVILDAINTSSSGT